MRQFISYDPPELESFVEEYDMGSFIENLTHEFDSDTKKIIQEMRQRHAWVLTFNSWVLALEFPEPRVTVTFQCPGGKGAHGPACTMKAQET